jgi:cysteine desulfurase
MTYYLDNASSYQTERYSTNWGNPHSLHVRGTRIMQRIREVEHQLLEKVNGTHGYLAWTGSGSEANRLAIETFCRKGGLVTSDIEHKSIWAHRRRYGNTLEVNKKGLLEVTDIERYFHKDISMVSIMLVNNELSTIQPVASVVGLARTKSPEALIHSDMAQAFGKMPIDLKALDLDLATFSAHKIGGPRGLGCLWVHNRVRGELPYLVTPPDRAIDYFGAAMDDWPKEDQHSHIEALEQSFLTGLGEYRLNIERDANRLPGILSICIPGIDATDLMLACSDQGIYISTTSACNNLKQTRSHVLQAIGMSDEDIDATIRISFSHVNEVDQVAEAGRAIARIIKELNGSKSTEDQGS